MWPKESEMRVFYGDPDPDRDGVPNRKWEDANIVKLVPPYNMVLAWDTSVPVKGIRIHRLCKDSLERALTQIAETFDPFERERFGLHLYGGGYNFRAKRGGVSLSTHSFGAAIDLSPIKNSWRRRWVPGAGMMPEEVVKAFELEGWRWGGLWPTPDAMHFQATK